ncbi:MAG TPA: hypothetical protein VFA16_14640, partial [Mycobacterium sp.]|uniref:YhgE/Pip domain-containing protein n=1 Tax=Mycobacterium sp. TaxID=1785 RepID=UPI002D6E11E8|nr:hypothetical protein [Mycobacterium sp.]
MSDLQPDENAGGPVADATGGHGHPQPRHAASSADRHDPGLAATREGARHRAAAGGRATRTVRFWLVPIVITLAVLSALAALYLGGILNPMSSLRHFPIAVVNEDAGPAGARIVDGVTAGLDKNQFDVRVLTRQEALDELNTARVFGMAVIPPDFSSKLRDLPQTAISAGPAVRPVITISTNPRAGTLGASIAAQTFSRVMAVVNTQVGQRLTAQVAQQTGGAPLAGAVSLLLANPVEV